MDNAKHEQRDKSRRIGPAAQTDALETVAAVGDGAPGAGAAGGGRMGVDVLQTLWSIIELPFGGRKKKQP